MASNPRLTIHCKTSTRDHKVRLLEIETGLKQFCLQITLNMAPNEQIIKYQITQMCTETETSADYIPQPKLTEKQSQTKSPRECLRLKIDARKPGFPT
ncbi:hypothetical protein CEXT_298921 [Caerostris extrusa]|uniref:Uncharacterized protein n=1 Tax=Caerostris extrusa TaxID=172846 RepID=A0AAV4PKE3_CAEEX|nr:hypothetical protein CEXT_298921 [Caerostris extrusa]